MTQDQKEAALNCVYAYETSDVYKALQDALTELEAHKSIAASFVKAEQESVPWYDREDSTNVLAEKAEQEPIMRKTTRDEKIVRPGVYEVSVEQAEQESFDIDDHPPHRLCECRKCMEYFTPLPDCDAFAASGKPIAEQTNTQLMEGFRPVSEMIAEHKQDPKKAAAIEKAKMRKAEHEPVAWVDLEQWQSGEYDCFTSEKVADYMTPLYTAPVRTKDLTDDDLNKLLDYWSEDERSAYGGAWSADGEYVDMKSFARAVIAADRKKNSG